METINGALKKNDFVICNRYTASNLAYGEARGLSVQWLASLDAGLPEARAVFVLDVPIPKSFSRKTRRRDVNERDRAFLEKVRRNYRLGLRSAFL
jgi:dTMP kinase